MPNYTSKYNLEKPLQEEFYDVDVQNSNMDKIDTALGETAEAANDHIANKNNPHGVSCDQIGALPLTGGTMNGVIIFNGVNANIKNKVDNSTTTIFGGTGWEKGAHVLLTGKDSTDKGMFALTAKDDTDTSTLCGKPDGRLIWSGYRITRDVDDEAIYLVGGTSTNTSSYVQVVGGSNSNGGEVYICAKSANGDQAVLSVEAEGKLSFMARDISNPVKDASVSGQTITLKFADNSTKALPVGGGVCCGTCSTAKGTLAKVATITQGSFTLEQGRMVLINFTNDVVGGGHGSSDSNITLNINSSGAKKIRCQASNKTMTKQYLTNWCSLGKGAHLFCFDGTDWMMLNNDYIGYTDWSNSGT